MLKKFTVFAWLSLMGTTALAATPQYTLRVALPRTPGAPIAPSTPVPATAPAAAWSLPSAPATTFGNAVVGANSQLALELKNTGTAQATLATPAFTGTDSSQFAVQSSTCTNVVAQGTCRLQLQFSPTSAGAKAATLTVDGKPLQYSGTGLPPPEPSSAMLMHFNGSFDDAYGTAVANINGTTLSSSSKFGTGTASFNGTNQGLMFSNQMFDFGAGDYTVEAWVRPRTGGGGHQSIVSNSWGWQLYWVSGKLSFYVSSSPTGPGYYSGMPLDTPAGSVPAGAWSHFAVVKYGSTLSIYVNGNKAATMPFTAVQVAPVYPASLGTIYTSPTATSYFYGGEIDEFRVTKNLARYTDNFTPAAQEFAR